MFSSIELFDIPYKDKADLTVRQIGFSAFICKCNFYYLLANTPANSLFSVSLPAVCKTR